MKTNSRTNCNRSQRQPFPTLRQLRRVVSTARTFLRRRTATRGRRTLHRRRPAESGTADGDAAAGRRKASDKPRLFASRARLTNDAAGPSRYNLGYEVENERFLVHRPRPGRGGGAVGANAADPSGSASGTGEA